MIPPAHLRARILEQVDRVPAPHRRYIRIRNAALLVSGVIVPLVIFAASGGVGADWRPTALRFETAFGSGVIALTTLVVVFGRGRSVLGRSGLILLSLAVVTPVLMLAFKSGVSAQFPGATDPSPTRPGFRCLRLGCLLSAWPLVAFILTRQSSIVLHPRAMGAAIGAAVGACSWVLVDLWCPVAYLPHLLFGHVLPLVVTTGLGWWLGGFLAVRRR